MNIEELLKAFEETGEGCGLISDDAGNWAVSTCGIQDVPKSPPEDVNTSFLVLAAEWKPTICEALQAYYDEFVVSGSSDNE